MANTGLGRGLGSLIPQKTNNQGISIPVNGKPSAMGAAIPASPASAPGAINPDKDRVLQISPNDISVNPLQPRHKFNDYEMDELVESIKEYGVIQPLIVTRQGGKFELIAGERRLRAAKKLGLAKIPAIVRDANKHEKLELALIENIQRQNLNPIELGEAYKRLMDEFGLTQEEVAKKVGKSRSGVANTLRTLALPEEIKLALVDGRLTEGHAKYLAGLDSEEKQMNLFRKIIFNNASVNDTGKEARRMGGTKQARIKINYQDKDKEFALREFFGAKVEVKRSGKGGQIIINFYSDEELNEIVRKVKK